MVKPAASAAPPPPPPATLLQKAGAFLSLVIIQVTLALVYKISQDPASGEYSFDPAAILTVAEGVKLALSLAFFAYEHLAMAPAARECERLDARARAAAAARAAAGEECDGGGDSGGDGGGVGGASDDERCLARADDESLVGYNGGDGDRATVSVISAATTDGLGAGAPAPRGPLGVQLAGLRDTFLDQAGLLASSSPQSRAIRWVCAGLAVAYCANNQLTFVLLQQADGANVNLIKGGASIVSTLMLRYFLDRRFSAVQWSAVCLQVCGLLVAQFGASCNNTPVLAAWTYLILIVSLCITSLTSVFNDKLLKEQRCSLHVINAVLYSFGVVFNLTLLAIFGRGVRSFFAGFDRASTYPVLLCNALIGIAVTAVYKYTDATMKTFGSACATSVLMIVSVLFYGASVKIVVIMGCLTVFIATHLYSANPKLPSPPTAARI